ncbi:unnamed protein product [Symbiodinium sp. CCMP2592]|nr:unnamed protein product [Symbiodinium sp. CCMP2592]
MQFDGLGTMWKLGSAAASPVQQNWIGRALLLLPWAEARCDFLQPLQTGEEECKAGVVVGMLQDGRTQCVAYASLGGTRSCADVCGERCCTAGLESPAAACEVAEAAATSARSGPFTVSIIKVVS